MNMLTNADVQLNELASCICVGVQSWGTIYLQVVLYMHAVTVTIVIIVSYKLLLFSYHKCATAAASSSLAIITKFFKHA